jgi:hypothetical protein
LPASCGAHGHVVGDDTSSDDLRTVWAVLDRSTASSGVGEKGP